MGTLGSFRVKRHAQDARLVRILHSILRTSLQGCVGVYYPSSGNSPLSVTLMRILLDVFKTALALSVPQDGRPPGAKHRGIVRRATGVRLDGRRAADGPRHVPPGVMGSIDR